MNSTIAWVVPDIGHPPELRQIPIESPRSGEVSVRVGATGLNFADLLMTDGTYQDAPPPPFVPGMEIAGVVTDVGPDVADIRPGDRVMSVPNSGGLAGDVVVQARNVRFIPVGMDDVIAAGFQVAYGSSHLALTRRANLRPGETLVVLGAAGGVGLTAVEIGHCLGARVVAVARGAEKLDVARKAGADVLIDSETGDLLGALRAAGPADVVYDAVGGEAGNAALRSMAAEGRFLIIGFASGSLPTLKPNHLLVKNQTVMGFYWGGYRSFNPQAIETSLSELCEWHAQGRIKPHIGRILPFGEAPAGLELLRNRAVSGKVVVTRSE